MTVNPSLQSASSSAFSETLQKVSKQLIPPIICTVAVLTVWQLLCLSPDTKMPGPIRVLQQTFSLIINPFYDDGGTSKGLGWQIWISLQRVMIGYSLAAVVGIALGVLIGMSQFMRRGLDPMIQVLRTVSASSVAAAVARHFSS